MGLGRLYRSLKQGLMDFCQQNHLRINAGKGKELMMDFQRCNYSLLMLWSCQGRDTQMLTSFKYLGVHLNNKLDWTHIITALNKMGQGRLCSGDWSPFECGGHFSRPSLRLLCHQPFVILWSAGGAASQQLTGRGWTN